MKLQRRLGMTLFVLILAASARGQTRDPQIGFLYPAGAKRGAVTRIIVGGQMLRGPQQVIISGKGVQAKVVKYMRPPRNINGDQRKLIQAEFKKALDARMGELFPERKKSTVSDKPKKAVPKADTPGIRMPQHPLLENMEDKSLRELSHLYTVLYSYRGKQQINRQLGELVMIDVTVDKNAPNGDRELRLRAASGITNPVVFQIGTYPEVCELEPNNSRAYQDFAPLLKIPRNLKMPKEKPLALPVVLNGQVMPGDVDRFRFAAKKGQNLVVQVSARRLIPYLADAVPGWFQATVAIYDAAGRELAYADDYRFHPDPVMCFKVPKDGEYELAIRDALYRGREDFVYRVAVGRQPFVTQMFPLGGREGEAVTATVKGWNLSDTKITLDTQAGERYVRHAACTLGKLTSNQVPYHVDSLPECLEKEDNNSIGKAHLVSLPIMINGRSDRAGDRDVFAFRGKAGDRVVAEVWARRLASPMDSLVRITDLKGDVLAWNDDHMVKDEHLHLATAGRITHHADSYLMFKLPKDGTYYVHMQDSRFHGGDAHAYRLRLSAPRPDFELCVTPTSLIVLPGEIAAIKAYALRKDGFDGDIRIALKNAPAGFKLEGGCIPAGRNDVHMTLTAPPKNPPRPVTLTLVGRARLGDERIVRRAVPANDVMQAFLYRHLLPAKDFLVSFKQSRWPRPAITLAGGNKVTIPAGGSARVVMKTLNRSYLKELKLVLKDPPEGLTLGRVAVVPQGISFFLKADPRAMPEGFSDNVIVEALREYRPKLKNGKLSKEKKRYSMGVLPAIPIEVVAR